MEKINGLKNSKYTLLILSMQKCYYDNNNVNISITNSMNSACEYINMAIDLFRKKDLPIIWMQEDGIIDEDLITPTMDINFIETKDEDFEIIDKLKQNKLKQIITKKRGRSGFYKTGLLEYIKENEIDILIITGFSAEYDVLYTYKEAEDYDLKPLILKNGIVGIVDRRIEFVEKECEIITINELEKIIE
jgi:nicotinamidase-related amidase